MKAFYVEPPWAGERKFVCENERKFAQTDESLFAKTDHMLMLTYAQNAQQYSPEPVDLVIATETPVHHSLFK